MKVFAPRRTRAGTARLESRLDFLSQQRRDTFERICRPRASTLWPDSFDVEEVDYPLPAYSGSQPSQIGRMASSGGAVVDWERCP